MSVVPGLAGLVLAGGQSSRFGSDKAVQTLGGKTLLEWSLATLDAVCEHVAVSAQPGSPAAELAEALGRQVFLDELQHPPGPLNGITGALVWAEKVHRTHLATLPCDTPMVTPAVMYALRKGAYAHTPDGPQALCAVWPVTAWNTLIGYMGRGIHPPVREALEAAGLRPVYFEDPAPFANVNTPADLAALEAKLSAERKR